ncbi:MAG: alpha/beta fold hydrolase [Parvibaculum sp.]|nr:alpha/beta fold hydrolase [Parvibaculum sp.]
MSRTDYLSDIRASAIAENQSVLAGHPSIGALPLVCRWPSGRQPEGAVVFCHGLGSNGDEYAALSAHWASHGYLVIHPTFRDAIGIVMHEEPHLRRDTDVDLSHWTASATISARMHEILHSPDRWLERVATVGNIMDQLPVIAVATCGKLQSDTPVAIAGHSFGAYTAQLLAGAQIALPDAPARGFRDTRFAAAILLSAQGREQQGLRDGSWDFLDGPVLTVTGTLDRGAKGGDWRWKAEPYECAPVGDKYLAVLESGDHFLGGMTERDIGRKNPAQQEAVKQMTLAFIDAHLRGRAAARDWLDSIGSKLAGAPLLFKHK